MSEIVKIANREYATDFNLYLHAINVATMATNVAMRLNLDEELCFNAGLLHDVGKMYCGLHIVPDHPKFTYNRLKDIGVSDEIAGIAAVHHQFQEYPYPEFIDSIMQYTKYKEAELISLCDKTEAYMTRSRNPPNRAILNAVKEHPTYDSELVDALKQLLYGDAHPARYIN